MNTLFDTTEYTVVDEDFTSEDYETPPVVAAGIARLARYSEKRILEPSAGRGSIVRELARRHKAEVTAIELKPNRVNDGRVLAPDANWICGDFLNGGILPPDSKFDLIVTNPPFSWGIEFIERSLALLKDERSRLLFLLPGDYFASQERNDRFESLNCCISYRWRIRGRVDYLKEGILQTGRQIYDSVYEIRPGKNRATESVL